jgi:saccharopine dehydrogenase-like NADP-dependent oxidoreductase
MPKAVVLGAGMVGSIIATDLAGDDDFEVTLADVRPQALEAARCRAPAASGPCRPAAPTLTR